MKRMPPSRQDTHSPIAPTGLVSTRMMAVLEEFEKILEEAIQLQQSLHNMKPKDGEST